jgi:hypothetical protein
MRQFRVTGAWASYNPNQSAAGYGACVVSLDDAHKAAGLAWYQLSYLLVRGLVCSHCTLPACQLC